MDIANHGLCVISDKYFSDFPSHCHMDNKHENRPYYLALRNESGIIWLIPLSSRVEKYKAAIAKYEEKYGIGNCLYYYIAKIKGEDRAILIGNAIPVTESYIKHPFTVSGKPYILKDKESVKAITSRFSRYLSLVRCHKLKPAVDILGIESKLLKK